MKQEHLYNLMCQCQLVQFTLARFAIYPVLPLPTNVSFRSGPARWTGISGQSGRTLDTGLADLPRGSDAAGGARLAGAASLAVLSGGAGRALQSRLALLSRLTRQST